MISETTNYWRKLVIWALEHNPRGYKKINGQLTNGMNGRCALGLISEELHIDPSTADMYHKFFTLTGSPSVWVTGPNDRGDSFKMIAERLRNRWNIPAEE